MWRGTQYPPAAAEAEASFYPNFDATGDVHKTGLPSFSANLIRNAELFSADLVMVGEKTHKASGVLKEVAMARKLDVKVVQIIGYKDGVYTSVPDAGPLYKWNWDNLKKLLS